MLKIEYSIMSYIQRHKNCQASEILNDLKSINDLEKLQGLLECLLEERLIQKPPTEALPSCRLKLTARGYYALEEYREKTQQEAAEKAEAESNRRGDRAWAIFSGALFAIIGAVCAVLIPKLM